MRHHLLQMTQVAQKCDGGLIYLSVLSASSARILIRLIRASTACPLRASQPNSLLCLDFIELQPTSVYVALRKA